MDSLSLPNIIIASFVIAFLAYFFSGSSPANSHGQRQIDRASKNQKKILSPELQRFKDSHEISGDSDTVTFAVEPNLLDSLDAMNLISELSKLCKVVILYPATSENEEALAHKLLSAVIPSHVPRHRLIFFKLPIGKAS